jgi:Fe-S oxidoreductase
MGEVMLTAGRLLNGFNQFLAFSPLYAATIPAESVFWPGCAAMKLSSSLMTQTWLVLREREPSLGFSSWCCGRPTLAIGGEGRRRKLSARLSAYFAGTGIKRVYALCPTCLLTLGEFPGVEAISAWPSLERHSNDRPMTASRFTEKFVLHDPCASKADHRSQTAIRRILDSRGVAFEEPRRNGSNARCCGRRNMAFLIDPEASRKRLRARLEDLGDFPIVTYCESCVEAFRSAKHKSVHLLEILFNSPSMRGSLNRVRNSRLQEPHA